LETKVQWYDTCCRISAQNDLITQVQPIHAYQTLSASEGVQALLREAAITDVEAPGPSRLLVNLALKSEQLGNANSCGMPFRLNEIDFPFQLETTVDLLPSIAKPLAGLETVGVEKLA
jgi:hypothetical protein